MRRFMRLAVATAASGLLAAGTFTALTVTAPPAKAGVAGSCHGTGTPIACTVTGLVINSPQSVELNATSAPGQKPVQLQWTAVCLQNGQSATTSGGGDDTTPAWELVQLGFSNPDSCTVTAAATLPGTSSTSSGAPNLTLNVDDNAKSPSPSASASASSSAPAPNRHYTTVRGFAGKCVDDAGNSSSLRAKIQIWSCNSADAAQGITYSRGELKHNNLCLNAKGNGQSGSKVILWTCNGSANELWIHKADGEYVEKANGGRLCLDDPRYSTKNGTQLMVFACHNSSNQHWSLP